MPPLAIPDEVENNPQGIVEAVGQEYVDVYRFLSERFLKCDPQFDCVYQFVFRSFYRLDNAGLTGEFKDAFFKLLSDARVKRSVDVEKVVRALLEFQNRKGQTSIQFSFATKLANAVDSSLPIHDAEVARTFGSSPPYTYKSNDQRIGEYLRFYTELKRLYESILSADQLSEARRLFRERYLRDGRLISETKVLDFIFWSAGRLSRDA